MKTGKTVLFAVAACIASLGIGCAPPYAVLEQAAVAPLQGATSFAVLDVDTTALARDSRSDREVLAGKGYVDGPREISRSFAAYLRVQAAREGVAEVHRDPEAAHFVIRPRLERMEPGHVDLGHAPALARVAARLDRGPTRPRHRDHPRGELDRRGARPRARPGDP